MSWLVWATYPFLNSLVSQSSSYRLGGLTIPSFSYRLGGLTILQHYSVHTEASPSSVVPGILSSLFQSSVQ